MKILICDNYPVFREGVRQILGQLPQVTLITEAGDAKETVNLLKNEIFDIVILDISLPDRNGLEVLQFIKEKWPSIKVLILSGYSAVKYAVHAIEIGASGFLMKNAKLEEMLLAVSIVLSGGKYISQTIMESFANYIINPDQEKHNFLSGREFMIMIKLANGRSLKEIGDELIISPKTVSTYRKRIMKKLSLSSNTDLARYCHENNLG